MTERERIKDQLRRAYEGDAWHGPAVKEVLHGIGAADAAAHPVPGAHSIWEIVLHMTSWTREVTRRLGGARPAQPLEGDWPSVPEPTAAGWTDAQATLTKANEALRQVVDNVSEEQLESPVGTSRDAPLGTGVTFYGMLHGLVQHDAYHIGQVALLKKALRR